MTISAGQEALSADVNQLKKHRKQFSDATERTTTSATFVDTSTAFTFTAPANSLIVGGHLKFEMHASGGAHTAAATLKINGSTLGTFYLNRNYLIRTSGGDDYLGGWETSETNFFITDYAPYGYVFGHPIPQIKIEDASTTFTIRIKSNGAATTGIKNVTLTLIYVEVYTED